MRVPQGTAAVRLTQTGAWIATSSFSAADTPESRVRQQLPGARLLHLYMLLAALTTHTSIYLTSHCDWVRCVAALDVLARVAGKTSEEKAASARSLGEAALKDAEIKVCSSAPTRQCYIGTLSSLLSQRCSLQTSKTPFQTCPFSWTS